MIFESEDLPFEMNRRNCELENLRAENLALREMLSELATDLECEIDERYKGMLHYSCKKAKYDRDIKPVIKAKQLLEKDNK